MARYIHEIYFRHNGDIHSLVEKLRKTFNWPEHNPNNASQLINEDGVEIYKIQVNALEFVIVPNEGVYHVSEYSPFPYYLYIRWNVIDRDPAQKLFSPMLNIMGNALYRDGYEIEVDCLMIKQSREEIKKNDPLLEIEQEMGMDNLLGL